MGPPRFDDLTTGGDAATGFLSTTVRVNNNIITSHSLSVVVALQCQHPLSLSQARQCINLLLSEL